MPRPVAAYAANLLAARSCESPAPVWLPWAAWVIATDLRALPQVPLLGRPGFQRASKTSCAAKGRPLSRVHEPP